VIDAQSIEIHRRLPASIDEVFRWWTDANLLKEWMTPIGTVEADVDLRVGGRLRIVMMGDGRVIEHTGQYLEIDPPRRLVFTWVSPYTGSVPSVITIELQAAGEDLTDLRLIHSQLPDEAARWHRGGWDAMLDRLGSRLQGKEGLGHAG
jgi:uncharacterized protein YndB with AHSA1/START domain